MELKLYQFDSKWLLRHYNIDMVTYNHTNFYMKDDVSGNTYKYTIVSLMKKPTGEFGSKFDGYLATRTLAQMNATTEAAVTAALTAQYDPNNITPGYQTTVGQYVKDHWPKTDEQVDAILGTTEHPLTKNLSASGYEQPGQSCDEGTQQPGQSCSAGAQYPTGRPVAPDVVVHNGNPSNTIINPYAVPHSPNMPPANPPPGTPVEPLPPFTPPFVPGNSVPSNEPPFVPPDQTAPIAPDVPDPAPKVPPYDVTPADPPYNRSHRNQ